MKNLIEHKQHGGANASYGKEQLKCLRRKGRVAVLALMLIAGIQASMAVSQASASEANKQKTVAKTERTLAAMGYPRVSGWLLYFDPVLTLRPVPPLP